MVKDKIKFVDGKWILPAPTLTKQEINWLTKFIHDFGYGTDWSAYLYPKDTIERITARDISRKLKRVM